MNFMLPESSDPRSNELTNLRHQFLDEHQEIQREAQAHTVAIANITAKQQALDSQGMNIKSLLADASRVVQLVGEHDPVALKNAYSHLFARIIVGKQNEAGSWPLRFLFKDQLTENIEDLEESVHRPDALSVDDKMAQEEGIEPPTQRLTAACSTSELLLSNNRFNEA